MIVCKGMKMKQLKVLFSVSCLLFVLNCTTTPPSHVQEDEQTQVYLRVTGNKNSTVKTKGVDTNEEHAAYRNMNEETFRNLLIADLDKLSLIEGIWSNYKNTYKIGIQKTGQKGTYVAFILNSRDPSVNKGDIIADFFHTRHKKIYFTKYYLKDNTKIVTKANIFEYGMLLISLEKWGKEDVAFFRNSLLKETGEENKASALKQSFSQESKTGHDEYYVQVVASKNHDGAQKLLVKIKKYYPEAYIVVQNNFSKIRIPGVLTKKQGAIVSRDIENKFNLKPMVVQKK